jgi:hypothetical protein
LSSRAFRQVYNGEVIRQRAVSKLRKFAEVL